MASLTRRIARKRSRLNKTFVPATQPTIINDDGSYRTLTATKGWRVVCAARARMYA